MKHILILEPITTQETLTTIVPNHNKDINSTNNRHNNMMERIEWQLNTNELINKANPHSVTIISRTYKTPPSLSGNERSIAYNHRKYHSGWICKGDCIPSAGT
jgi:hypothetical protein